tara:strand:+ start:1266 stop:2357 length:1092 start_codon:yes stop_codon:yes gene_type:complete
MKKTPKVIVHVVQHLAPGGLESLALNMLAFSNLNHRILLVSLEGYKADAISKWPKLAKYEKQLLFLSKPQGKSGKTLFQLYKLFRLLKPHCVHTHHIGPILYGAIAARLAGISIRIHTEHDAWHLHSFKQRLIQSFALRVAKPRLVADAQRVSDQLNEYFSYQDLTVIKNGIDCEHFKPGSKPLARQALGLPVNAKIIGSAGRLEEVKGHDVLIKTLPLLSPYVHLVIAGNGSRRAQLETQANALGVANRVTFLGLVEDMPRFYQSLDLFCLPSRSEGFPLSTLEAQACGVKSIATDVGACNETLDPATGVLVPSEDHQHLANAIQQSLYAPITSSPRAFVLAHNDIRQMIHAYNTLTEEKLA